MKTKIEPTEGRKRKIQDLLWDKDTLRIYCDCSLNNIPIYKDGRLRLTTRIGVAAAFVYDGSVTVKSKPCPVPKNPGSVYGEMQAILFAISQIPSFLETLIVNRPTTILILTDLDQYTHYIEEYGVHLHLKELKLPITIQYLAEEKRYNPFYKASHNGARRSIGKNN